MAIRPGRTTRRIERPYTRVSKKVPRKSYVVGVPFPKIHQFEMGTKGEYNLSLYVIAKQDVQIRDNALEAARVVAHKFLTKTLGKNYFFKILAFPHHVIRAKPIATGAGADRYSQGMRLAFGKPTGVAVQVWRGQRLMLLQISGENLRVGKEALKKAGLKLPTPIEIRAEKI
ncbi:MAG: 50S ribosomal protein L16 [Candidatus Aenigmarchaeota archaeon]|nr:50S ribosomal protein L16 [Candidatus Aenigmarchaeota archaeon]